MNTNRIVCFTVLASLALIFALTLAAPCAPSAGAGSRLGFSGASLGVDPGAVEIPARNYYDYTFAQAPTDWVPGGGLWATTNRWTCSPQWSWYGGYNADGLCSIWNKREFGGDLCVEAYCGFKMGVGGVQYYRHPNDMSITICGDGANVDSGYSFIVGAEKNTEVRIMKGSTVLARTKDPQFLFPIFEDANVMSDLYQFHRRWWGLRVRKQGGHLELYIDNKLAVQADDPKPLDTGRMALWTVRNGLIVARVKVYYQREVL
jgi:hypothetical protein